MEASSGTVASTEYARKRRELLNLAKEIRAIGAESENIGMPRIAVIGKQSAGKSSIVEAITGIAVPRDDGTCTRCPMECTVLTTTEGWSCQISLRIENQQENYSPRLTSNVEVEIWIRRAQAAALDPPSKAEYKTKSADELRAITGSDSNIPGFTRNIVVVDIEDPEGTDLSFIDLPGLISNGADEMIEMVRNLVNYYIQNPVTIILLAIPANDDMENQEAAKMARQADPEGSRTIGLITKPDSITGGASGARQRWRKILLGEIDKHRLQLGYYSVRLRNDEERNAGMTRAQAERAAVQFFENHEPWKGFVHTGRVGVASVVANISKVLMRILDDALPKMKENVVKLLSDCNASLDALPKPIAVDAPTEVLSRVARFCNTLKQSVNGRESDKTFVHKNIAIYGVLKRRIRETAPDFRPFLIPSDFRKPNVLDFKDDDDDVEDDDGDGAGSVQGVGFVNEKPDNTPLGLYDVRRVIKSSTGWELPVHVPYEAKERLIQGFVDQWTVPSRECFAHAVSILSELTAHKLKTHFGRFQRLEQHISLLVKAYLETCRAQSFHSVQEVLERERFPYWTQNNHYLKSAREEWLSNCLYVRRNEHLFALSERVYGVTPSISSSQTHETRALNALAELGYRELKTRDLVRLHPPDGFMNELIVMADVRAYFQVSYKRIIDHVPMTIQRALNQQFAEGMQDYLLAELKLGSAETSRLLRDLLAEDPSISTRRNSLEIRKRQLAEIWTKLVGFVVTVPSSSGEPVTIESKSQETQLNNSHSDSSSQASSSGQPSNLQPSSTQSATDSTEQSTEDPASMGSGGVSGSFFGRMRDMVDIGGKRRR